MEILSVSNLKKVYTTRFGGNQVQALKNINFSVDKGEYVAVMGESGSGKSVFTKTFVGMLDGNGKDVTYTYDYVQLNVVRPTGKGSSAEVVASITVRQ